MALRGGISHRHLIRRLLLLSNNIGVEAKRGVDIGGLSIVAQGGLLAKLAILVR